MKVLRLTYSVLLLALVGLLAACSSDDIAEEQTNGTDVATLTLRIGTPEATAVTRARNTDWDDKNNAQDEEMMNIWVVILTNTSGTVQKCIACAPDAGAEREIDVVADKLKAADYIAYSFANISVAKVCELLGLTAPASIPTLTSTPQEIAVTGTVTLASAQAKTATINGNNFSPTAADNGFGSAGIPMSNVQTIASTETSKDLIVVRMLAKMEISIKNETGAPLTVTSIKLSDITKNTSDNLLLLPKWTTTTGKDLMPVAQHGDLQPNLNGKPGTEEMVVIVDENLAKDATITKTFYINETAKPDVSKTNAFQRFILTVETKSEGKEVEQRFALIDDQNTDDEASHNLNGEDVKTPAGKWDYIARNDYRIIPVVLDDYRLELVPYDFPAIGVYPASVKEEDGRFTINFHDYGHFHLVPYVTKISTGESVPFFNGEDTAPTTASWQLLPTSDTDNTPSFANSWKTYTALNGTELTSGNTTSPGQFYRIESTPAKVDGDEVGGVPFWYPNTSSPQWSPKGDGNYPPFIFGYIEDPEVAGGEDYWDAANYQMKKDKSIYHEFTVTLNRGNDTRPRLLKAGVLMILDKDQVLYARSTARGPRRPHCCH